MEPFLNLKSKTKPFLFVDYNLYDHGINTSDVHQTLRDVICDLYLLAFSLILPYYIRYDNCNYARWGAVYASATGKGEIWIWRW